MHQISYPCMSLPPWKNSQLSCAASLSERRSRNLSNDDENHVLSLSHHHQKRMRCQCLDLSPHTHIYTPTNTTHTHRMASSSAAADGETLSVFSMYSLIAAIDEIMTASASPTLPMLVWASPPLPLHLRLPDTAIVSLCSFLEAVDINHAAVNSLRGISLNGCNISWESIKILGGLIKDGILPSLVALYLLNNHRIGDSGVSHLFESYLTAVNPLAFKLNGFHLSNVGLGDEGVKTIAAYLESGAFQAYMGHAQQKCQYH